MAAKNRQIATQAQPRRCGIGRLAMTAKRKAKTIGAPRKGTPPWPLGMQALAAVPVGHDAGVAAVVAEDVPAVGEEADVALPALRPDDDAGLAVFPLGASVRVELAHIGVGGFDRAAARVRLKLERKRRGLGAPGA